jgi:outer membrane lipoprotein SlyB
MKCIAVIAAILLLGSNLANAQSNDTDKVIGAVVGGVIGSTIGDGDGQKIATALGALIGARMADGERYNRKDFVRECRKNVPVKYRRNDGARKAWIEGCVNRLEKIQAELEAEAYNEGVSDGSSN